MSSSGDSPSSWELMLSSALDMVGTPRKLLGVPGGVSDTSSVQMDPEQPPSSVREIVVVNEIGRASCRERVLNLV